LLKLPILKIIQLAPFKLKPASRLTLVVCQLFPIFYGNNIVEEFDTNSLALVVHFERKMDEQRTNIIYVYIYPTP